MSDIEAENKNLKEEQSEVSAPTEIGAPSVGSKDIRWYVIHTYSGYENKVKDTLTRKVHSMGMDDTILEILLPLQDEEEEKDGKTRVVAHKVFPGYLLIKMEVNDRSWYVVRNTPGVTGFVGTTTKPIPLSDEEADRIIHGMNTKKAAAVDVKAGDRVRITKGVFEDRTAVVLEVAEDKTKIKADISNFGTTSVIQYTVGLPRTRLVPRWEGPLQPVSTTFQQGQGGVTLWQRKSLKLLNCRSQLAKLPQHRQ